MLLIFWRWLTYDCRDISQLENLWHQVDEEWVKISGACRLFYQFHGMEKREHSFCVSPEFRLLRTENGEQEIANRIKKVRRQKFASKIGIKEEL